MDARSTGDATNGGGSKDKARTTQVRMIPRPTTRSLVMWSGGLDSTFTLVRLLERSDDEVHVHHVHCNTRREDGVERSRRCEYEAQAVSRMLPYLRTHYRAFRYSESRVDLTAFSCSARDDMTMMYFAAQAALSLGLTPFDRIVFGVNADDDTEWRPDTYAYRLRRLQTVRMLKAVWEAEEVPYFYLWNPRPSKQAQADYLPLDLFEMTAGCRNPVESSSGFSIVDFATCGACPQCRVGARLLHRSRREPMPATAVSG